MIVKKPVVVKVYAKMIRKYLNQYLPDEDFEYAMMERAEQIVKEKVGHIKEAI